VTLHAIGPEAMTKLTDRLSALFAEGNAWGGGRVHDMFEDSVKYRGRRLREISIKLFSIAVNVGEEQE
jgi:hypothetical protein